MRLLIQPGDGVLPIVKGINSAKRSVEIVIFRFDQREVEKALANAVSRGVKVHALIAHTNRAGEESLRKLEMRLLAAGVTVARTADDLVRYHNKLMIVDRNELYLLAFNFTHLDIEHSRSFAIITKNRDAVRSAVKLFDADVKRTPYEPDYDLFLVSPVNARQGLVKMIEAAKIQLLIYDPQVGDPAMMRLLEARAKAGVEIRIIGKLTRKMAGVESRRLTPFRLHTRSIVRDGKFAFIGSQSLRALELDGRRESGLVFRDPKVVASLMKTFQADWKASDQPVKEEDVEPIAKVAKRVAKAVTKELPPVSDVLEEAMKELMGSSGDLDVTAEELDGVVKDAVKTAVQEAVKNMVEEAVEQNGNGGGK